MRVPGWLAALAPGVDTLTNAGEAVIRVPNRGRRLHPGASATARVRLGVRPRRARRAGLGAGPGRRQHGGLHRGAGLRGARAVRGPGHWRGRTDGDSGQRARGRPSGDHRRLRAGRRDARRAGCRRINPVKLTGLFLGHRAAVYLAVALLTLGGVWALFTLPAGIYPEVTYPRIVVLARGGTFEAEQMTVAVTRPLEEAMSGVLGLRRVRTLTVRGSAQLSLDFRPNADMQFALSQVQGRLAAARGSLPDGLDLSAERLTPSVFPILQYELTGADPLVLRDLAELHRAAAAGGASGRGRGGGRRRARPRDRGAARSGPPHGQRRRRGPGGAGDRRHRPGGGGRPHGPRLPAVRHRRLGAHQHAGGRRPGRRPRRAGRGRCAWPTWAP